MELWPHQHRALNESTSAILAGRKRLCVTSPTGGGKTEIQFRLLDWAIELNTPASMYTNRKLLTAQTIRRLKERGIRFGVRAADFDEYLDLDAPIQICSLQTEESRVHKSMKWLPHRSDLVLIDEAHIQKGPQAQKTIDFHANNGAAIVGFTATPIGISNIYTDGLIVAGVTSELRDCGALVPCMVHAGPEIDTRNLKRQASGEFSIGEIRKKIWTPVIFGYVVDEWKKLNPDARPAILFAPGVEESAWFAKKFEEIGVCAAHIDSDTIYVDGKTYSKTPELAEEILARFKANEIKMLCNRFVLREGIDIPEIYHAIFATPVGSVTACVQMMGRVLRAHPTTPTVIMQDHGGNYWRHGSPNADRDWQSAWNLSDKQISDRREAELTEKKTPEPIVCPECGAVRMKGPSCYKCGHRHDKSVRMVIQKSGNLRPMLGDIFHPRKTSMKSDTQKKWDQCYWAAKKSGKMNFNQARGMFWKNNHYFPPETLANMPVDKQDWSRRVADVAFTELIKAEVKPDPQTTLEFSGAK